MSFARIAAILLTDECVASAGHFLALPSLETASLRGRGGGINGCNAGERRTEEGPQVTSRYFRL